MRHLGSITGHEFKAVTEHEQYFEQRLSTFFVNGYEGSSRIGASGPPEILLMGDSHAGSLRCGIDALLRERGVAGYAIICLDTDLFDLTLPKADAALRKLSTLPNVSEVILWRCGSVHDTRNTQAGFGLSLFPNRGVLVAREIDGEETIHCHGHPALSLRIWRDRRPQQDYRTAASGNRLRQPAAILR